MDCLERLKPELRKLHRSFSGIAKRIQEASNRVLEAQAALQAEFFYSHREITHRA
ncbi:hypothetical protein Dimus_019852, partial [Dionaea muscipula]